MANFYTDTPELKFHLNHPLMKHIVALKERNFSDKDNCPYAPKDFEDAMDNYNRVLEIAGEICGDVIAENAKDVDIEKPHVVDGRVIYASGTSKNLEACRNAGLMGMAMPRNLDGLNFPITPYLMAADMVSRADAGFENLWGLQDCAETLYEFGTDEQRKKYVPRVCAGETMSMDLTEPDAGSDLQAVMLKASFDEKENCWRLNGVKRFITNGDSNIHLVLARSEEHTHDGRGLSMFIYDKDNGGVKVRRIEDKMGIKGSPTCELVFKNAKAELCGDRRLGLIKYVMALMNGARLGITAQAVGIEEAAYREALAYARDRKQFGQAIIDMAPVSQILSVMKAKLDASRTLLYETCRYVDIYKALQDISRERKLTPEERQEMKKYSRMADSFTPLGKGIASEYANQSAYDAIQIHGGSGFMKDYACERIYRDARITSIYEGTTQLQVVAAIRYVTNGTYLKKMDEFIESAKVASSTADADSLINMDNAIKSLSKLQDKYAKATEKVVIAKNQEYLDLCSRSLVDMAGQIIMLHLLFRDAVKAPELFANSYKVYLRFVQGEVAKAFDFVENSEPEVVAEYMKK